MNGMTLCVGLVAAALVLLFSPRWGFVVYLITLLCYPSYLRLIVFGFTVSAGRLVVAALLMRCLLDEQLRRGFRWSKLDTLIIAADAVYFITLCSAATSLIAGLKYQSGFVLDTTFAYFSTRLVIINRAVLVHVVKAAVVVLVVMALLGAYEAKTTASPYKGMMKHGFRATRGQVANKFRNQEVLVGHGQEARLGFFRAQGPHSHPMIFGASFAILLPLVWKLSGNTGWRSLRIPIGSAIFVGGASSMSSTPFTGLGFVLAGLAFERLERWGRLLIMLAVFSCVFLEFYTERPHFYYVFLDRLSIQSGTGYFRGKLIDTAVRHLPEYWLNGYGLRDPGWGPEIWGVDYTDATVHFVYLMVLYGVFGLLAYLAIVFNLLFSLLRRYRCSAEKFDRDICWGLIVSIAVTLVIGLGLTPFGVLPTLYSIVFGIAATVVTSPRFKRKCVVAAQL